MSTQKVHPLFAAILSTIAPKTVALCDCCDKRPGTRKVWPYGIETWACDECCGDAPDTTAQSEEPCHAVCGEMRCALPKGHDGFHDDGSDPELLTESQS